MHSQFSILFLAGLAAASHSGNVLSRAQFTGIASFNNYSNQSNTVCGQKSENQRCGSSTTNQLDIDYNAYEQLTGTAFASGVANLAIGIQRE
ncbi:MAG: hypothetical protein Q9165_006214 [Trypethelium subeluteriae]